MNNKLDKLKVEKIENDLRVFESGNGGKNKGRGVNERYASFDFCFNYFHSFEKKSDLANEDNLEKSCLQLGFYLASWGMYRGSSFLLEKSVANFKEVVKIISKKNNNFWDIDVNNYNIEKIEEIIKCKNEIKTAFGKNKIKTWDTLISKIMLGVFGNVPAYDQYFKKFLKKVGICQTFNKKSLIGLKELYEYRKNIIDKYDNILAFNFNENDKSKRKYTKAKIIDMIGFIEGQR